MHKAELRKTFLQQRLSLSPEETVLLNKRLTDQFFQSITLERVHVIHTFLPFQRKNEPDTWQIISRLQHHHSHIRISVPRVNTSNGTLESFYYDQQSQLITNLWGIAEPTGGLSTLPGDIDIVLVPLLTFDWQGHRVGYGKGFYDRFLVQCNPDCLKIGISFFGPATIDDTEIYDQRLDSVITPEKVYFF